MRSLHVLSMLALLAAASINISCKKNGNEPPDEEWPADSIRTVKQGGDGDLLLEISQPGS